MKDNRKTFEKLLHKAVFILSDASELVKYNETHQWHIDEAVAHIVAALDHEELIKQEEKESKK